MAIRLELRGRLVPGGAELKSSRAKSPALARRAGRVLVMAVDVTADVLGTQPRYVGRIADGQRNAGCENSAG